MTLRFENKLKWFGEERFAFISDDLTFLTALTRLWSRALQNYKEDKNKYPYRIKQVSISIHNLNAFEQTQGDLFSEDEQTRQKQEIEK